ncbi:cupin domain-containing protein [bacterium]|nr:cupin domain-containing protein [bacterium]
MLNNAPRSPELSCEQEPQACLHQILTFCRTTFEREVAKHRSNPFYSHSRLNSEALEALRHNIHLLEAQSQEGLAPVFEDPDPIENITATAWKACDYAGLEGEDAIIRMRFERGSKNLPLHSHDHSDRVLIVTSGNGFGYYQLGEFSGSEVRRIEVSPGTLIVFPRGTLHTFECTTEDIVPLAFYSV